MTLKQKLNGREEKDLGVHISNDLKWEKQCSQAVAKANKALGLTKRNFKLKLN